MFEKMKSLVEMAKKDAAGFMADKLGQANITGIAMAIFVLVVIGYVSIYVVNEIHGIAGITTTSVFYTASTKVINVMNTSWGRLRARIRQFKAYITNIQKPDSRESYESLNHQNDAHRRYSGACWSYNRSNKRRTWWRCWRRNNVDTQKYNNKRGHFPLPLLFFQHKKHKIFNLICIIINL